MTTETGTFTPTDAARVDAADQEAHRLEQELFWHKRALERVRLVHRRRNDDGPYCDEDGWDWPCPTIRAMDDPEATP